MPCYFNNQTRKSITFSASIAHKGKQNKNKQNETNQNTHKTRQKNMQKHAGPSKFCDSWEGQYDEAEIQQQ